MQGWTFADRAQLYQRCGGNPNAARSTVYAWHESLDVCAVLTRRGIVGEDGRDTRTRRKVLTICREMSRFAPPGGPSTWTTEQADEIVKIYELLRDKPLGEITRICREAAR